MRILLDACVGARALAELRARGHDVERVIDDRNDAQVLDHARQGERVLVTADKDFGALVFVQGHASSGILRVVDHPLSRQPSVVADALERYERELEAGALVVVEPARVRVRVPPSSGP